MSYVVSIKRSARLSNGEVGTEVNESGSIRRFDSRQDADRWARLLTHEGETTVWVQDAPPHDPTNADGYLVARRERITAHRDSARSGSDGDEQVELTVSVDRNG